MCVNVFRLLFFHIWVVECAICKCSLSLNLSNIFLIATAEDNYVYKVGSFAIEIRIRNKWMVPILNFKEFTLSNIKLVNIFILKNIKVFSN